MGVSVCMGVCVCVSVCVCLYVSMCVCVGGGGAYYRGRPVWVGRCVREEGPCASENDAPGACTGALRLLTLT